MLGLNDLEIGLMFWAREDARATLRDVKAFGLRAGQLGFGGDLKLDGAAERWDEALRAEKFTATTAVCSFTGEEYSDIPTVAKTVGLVPPATRAERTNRIKTVSDIGSKLGIDSIACHIGFVPHAAEDPLYEEIRKTTLDLCRYCHGNGQSFTLETGQEPAKVLLRFIEDVHHPALRINFDPANMILYGTGDPIEALGQLKDYVVSVHCKDGDWPDMDKPQSLGEEKPIGKGKVDFPAYITKLKEIGYRGLLAIEREGDITKEQKMADIRGAITLLQRLTTPAQTAQI